MNRRNRQVLAQIFEIPTRADIRWAEVERLLKALGGTVREGRGSRVRCLLGDRVMVLHRPHPKPELRKYQVEAVRRFLTEAGEEPGE